MIRNTKLVDRFLRYVKIDTQSSEEAEEQPSTQKQRVLADLLAEELEALGAAVDYDREHCYIYASVPGNGTADTALGFIAHMDTSPAVSGAGVAPRIIGTYDGTDEILTTEDFPELLHHIGEDLIATDGKTLLGADDKAGIAEIMNMLEYFFEHPEIKHRPIRVALTPDEEIGRGTENFDVARFGAAQAYTVDGGKLGVIEYECFHAAAARVTVSGRSVHTGDAKNRMINAVRLAMEYSAMLPEAETPEHTEGYEGFYHLDKIRGDVEEAVLDYILRDHDREKFQARKNVMLQNADYMNRKYGSGNVNGINVHGKELVRVEIRDQYSNMAEIMKDHMELITNAEDALRSLGVEPVTEPIRGGTDGAALSFMGVPCPNLCTGGYNYHSRYEYASVQEMEKTAELLILLAKAESEG
uniref:peptidase T n=1 Tax=Eubacterium cellulosolvens TaxID=29322 RepID=UPI0004843253|nr:peptidase T [[Eubacterium] cellulosolvens]